MASVVPPDNAEQLKTLLAQYDKRLRKRLAIWGAVAATSLVVAVGVSLFASGGNRAETASSGGAAMPDMPMAAAALPPAELRAFKQASEAFKRATDQTATKLASVERNTAAARAETKRLADQVNKLSVDSFRFTGRLANIEHQIDGITGSITKVAQKAAADAVAKAMPAKPGASAFESPAPLVSPPATTLPKISQALPPTLSSPDDTLTTGAIKAPGTPAKPDTMGDAEAMARVEMKASDHKTSEPARNMGEIKAEVGVQPKNAKMAKNGAIEKRWPGAEAAKAAGKAADQHPAKTAKDAKTAKPPTRLARVEPRHYTTRYHYRSSNRTSYGVDLGGAASVDIAKAQWAAVKANFGPILIGMRPIAVRNHRFLTDGSFRLVAGHVRSWAAAKRVCTLLARQKFACEPVKFEGDKVFWQ